MLKDYIYVKGQEVKTVEQLKNCVDGIIISDKYENCAYDNFVLLRDDDIITQTKIDAIWNSGRGIFKRQKAYREPVFTREIDNQLADIIVDVVTAYAIEDDTDLSVIAALRKIKQILLED